MSDYIIPTLDNSLNRAERTPEAVAVSDMAGIGRVNPLPLSLNKLIALIGENDTSDQGNLFSMAGTLSMDPAWHGPALACNGASH